MKRVAAAKKPRNHCAPAIFGQYGSSSHVYGTVVPWWMGKGYGAKDFVIHEIKGT